VLKAPSPEPVARSLRVLAAGAVKSVMQDLFGGSGSTVGASMETIFDTVGALSDRVLEGERADILILSASVMEDLVDAGRIDVSRSLELGRTGVALAGPTGGPRIVMDTPDQFREVLLAAPSIGHADPARGATAGIHFVKCLRQLGLDDLLRDRIKVFPFGVDAVSAVGRGEIAIAVSQATEILPRPDVACLGLFPEPFQIWTSYRAVALADHPAARYCMDALASLDGAFALRRAGFS
jgi:molybdate transport system substrate-binding protein